MPPVDIVHHATPSPHTIFGQKGSGESGYRGAPAAIASAVNDALQPLGIVVNSLPIKMAQLVDMIAAARDGRASPPGRCARTETRISPMGSIRASRA